MDNERLLNSDLELMNYCFDYTIFILEAIGHPHELLNFDLELVYIITLEALPFGILELCL